MAEIKRERGEVNARIAYWGIAGAGKSTNLRVIFEKLRPDHRGELRRLTLRGDPPSEYEMLPIELGRVGELNTRIQITALPGAPEHAAARSHLLDRVDGIALIVDTQRHRLEENLASVEELRSALHKLGRSLEDLPLVIQYNKCDLSDASTVEALHNKLGLTGAPIFQAVALHNRGVLQTLTTLSKQVVRALRSQALESPLPEAPPAAPLPRPEREFPYENPLLATPSREERLPDFLESEKSPLHPARVERSSAWPNEERDRGWQEPLSVPTRTPAFFESDPHDALEAAAITARTEALLDTSWEELARHLRLDSPDFAPQRASVSPAGEPRWNADRSLKVPLALRDERGREVRFALNVRFEIGEPRDGG